MRATPPSSRALDVAARVVTPRAAATRPARARPASRPRRVSGPRRVASLASSTPPSFASIDAGQSAIAVAGAPPEPYRPSPMDTSALLPQLVALACVALAVGYVQAVLTPTARARFDAANPEKRARVKELMAGDDGDGRGLERWYYRNVLLRSGLRPRGDQTRGGTIVPGLNDAGADDARGPGIGGARRSTGGARGGASAGKGGGGEERRDAVADRGGGGGDA